MMSYDELMKMAAKNTRKQESEAALAAEKRRQKTGDSAPVPRRIALGDDIALRKKSPEIPKKAVLAPGPSKHRYPPDTRPRPVAAALENRRATSSEPLDHMVSLRQVKDILGEHQYEKLKFKLGLWTSPEPSSKATTAVAAPMRSTGDSSRGISHHRPDSRAPIDRHTRINQKQTDAIRNWSGGQRRHVEDDEDSFQGGDEEVQWRQSKVSELIRDLAYGKHGRYEPDSFDEPIVSPRMESSFAEMEREDKRAARVGAQEDRIAAKEERDAAERKRRRLQGEGRGGGR